MTSKKNDQLCPAYMPPLTPKIFSTAEQSDYSCQKKKHASVFFIGDSITNHWAETHPEFFCRNNFSARGVCGETSQDVLERFHLEVQNSDASIIVVLCGRNDLSAGCNEEVVANVLHNLSNMCDDALCMRKTILLCSLTPSMPLPWESQEEKLAETIKRLNHRIETLAAIRHLPYADYYTQMVTSQGEMRFGLTQDGCHPTEKGFCIMERVVTRVLQRLTGQATGFYVTPDHNE